MSITKFHVSISVTFDNGAQYDIDDDGRYAELIQNDIDWMKQQGIIREPDDVGVSGVSVSANEKR